MAGCANGNEITLVTKMLRLLLEYFIPPYKRGEVADEFQYGQIYKKNNPSSVYMI